MAVIHPFKHLVALLSAPPGLKVPKIFPGMKVSKSSGMKVPKIFPGMEVSKSSGMKVPKTFPGMKVSKSSGMKVPKIFPGMKVSKSSGMKVPKTFPGMEVSKSSGMKVPKIFPGMEVSKTFPGMEVPKTSSTIRTGSIILFLFIFLFLMEATSGLKCFECGAYIPPDEYGSQVKLLPCPVGWNLSLQNDLKECKPGAIFCLKYVSQGIEIRKCAESCVDDHNPYADRTIACCDDDACNKADKGALLSMPSLLVSLGLGIIRVGNY